jgi:hypothetical protein
MAKSQADKMKEKKDKMKTKKENLKAKLKGKVAVAGAVACLAVLLAGCQTADPASRSNEAAYGDLEPRITINGSSNTVSFTMTIGDGVLASADGGGDTQSNTPTQTTDTKPEVAVGVGGGSAGTGGGSPTSGLTDTILNALRGLGLVTDSNTKEVKAAVDAACTDGSCAPK